MKHNSLRLYSPVVIALVLLFGFALRTIDTGSAPLQVDEAWVAYLAFAEGHNGQRAELGMKTSTGLDHSPFMHDVMSVSFAFDPDPRIARLFLATLHLVSMAVFYLMVKRYWRERTALAALLLYIVIPRGVLAGRYLWNPYLVAPFFIGYLFTGFLIMEGKRWARLLHPALLICALQAHPAMATLAPITLAFYVWDWRKRRVAKQPFFLRDHVIGGALAVLLMVPWFIGIMHLRASTPEGTALLRFRRTSIPSFVLSSFIDYASFADFGALGIPQPDYIPPPPEWQTVYDAISWLALLGGFFVIGRGLVQRQRYRDVFVGVAYLIMPGLLLILPTRTYSAYFIPLMPLAALIEAMILVGDGPRKRQWLRAGSIAVIAICAVQVILVVNWLEQVHDFHHFTRGSSLGLNDMVTLRNEAVRPGYETIYLVDGAGPGDFVQGMSWLTLATKGPSRVIWGSQITMPIPAAGVTYVGFADATLIPELYAQRKPRFVDENLYRVVDLPPNSGFTPTCRPVGPTHLSNGATIVGYYVPQSTPSTQPQPEKPWTIYLLWQGDPKDTQQSYQIFNHLVDATETRHAQNDVPTLVPNLWRAGELLVTKVDLTPDKALPSTGPLYLRVGMYTLPTVTNASVLDDNGNPVASWVTIPICQPKEIETF
ncbi:MAG: hypothetical protein ABI947_07290 [Chloroflexota bacterium]